MLRQLFLLLAVLSAVVTFNVAAPTAAASTAAAAAQPLAPPQADTLTAGVFSPATDRPILKGATRDLSDLSISLITLRAGQTFDREHRPSLLAPAALSHQALEAHVGVKQGKARLRRLQAENSARRLLRDQCSRTSVRRDSGSRRDVTSADILGQGTPYQLVQLVAAHCMDEADLSR